MVMCWPCLHPHPGIETGDTVGTLSELGAEHRWAVDRWLRIGLYTRHETKSTAMTFKQGLALALALAAKCLMKPDMLIEKHEGMVALALPGIASRPDHHGHGIYST